MCVDKAALKSQIDLLVLAEKLTSLKKKSNTNGGEWAGPCPFCPEHGVDRFVVQPNANGGGRWLCRYCTAGKWQDVFELIKRRDGTEFPQALKLAKSYAKNPAFLQALIPAPTIMKPIQTAIPSARWQTRGMEFVEKCVETLRSDPGQHALKFLRERGLNDQTIEKYRIGYHSGNRNHENLYDRNLAAWDLVDAGIKAICLPAGIVIPNLLGDTLFGIKIRRIHHSTTSKDSKFEMIKGSRPGIFGASNFFSSRAILTEGEFDAMLLDQIAGDLIGIGTLGSAGSNITSLDPQIWFPYLLPLKTIYLIYDADAAGNNGCGALQSVSNRFVRLLFPEQYTGKDVTDLWKSGLDLRKWITNKLQIDVETGVDENHLSSNFLSADSMINEYDLNEITDDLNSPFVIDPTLPCTWCGGTKFNPCTNGDGFVCSRCHPSVETLLNRKVYHVR